MSDYILHIIAPSHYDDVAALIGDLAALQSLREAVDDAIASGTGGAFLTQSDGEYYVLPVVRVPDMTHVYTAYATQPATVRSEREAVPLRAVHGMMDAIRKSIELGQTPGRNGKRMHYMGHEHEAASAKK